MKPFKQILRAGTAVLAVGAACVAAVPAVHAQAVVQALPDPAIDDLNQALQRLSGNPNSVPALVQAGRASLKLEDVDAAKTFFDRARAADPRDARVLEGLAVVAVRQRRAVEAIDLFTQAERAGSPLVGVEADRGLAYDLVGDNARAQAMYGRALSREQSNELIRRLALSYAIAGDREASEATLLPLLQRRDLGAYRARAFALAILGQEAEAVSIIETMLPERLATRLSPYMRIMPRLTRAQQAAAANLGVFPATAQIGRDDPAIAAASAAAAASAPQIARNSVDQRLIPGGQALGTQQARVQQQQAANSAASRNRNSRNSRNAPSEEVVVRDAIPKPAPTPTPTPTPMPAPTPAPAPALAPPPTPAPTPASAAVTQVASGARSGELPALDGTPAPTPAPPSTTAAIVTEAPPPSTAAPVVVARAEDTVPRPSFSLAEPAPTPAPAPAFTPAAAPDPAPATQQVDLSEIFADLDRASDSAIAPRPDAVDITAIEVPRERPAPPPAPTPPPLPQVPSRQWVQIATGQDTAAFRFDWRRIAGNSDGLLDDRKAFYAPWGQSNRLLTGPFESARAANDFVASLKAAGVDAFRFASAAGEDVTEITNLPAVRSSRAPAAPANPARQWVQVATGQDTKAFRFDWRRIAGKSGGLLTGREAYYAAWGQTNRLLTGPFDSEKAANEFVAKLKAAGVDSFRFASSAGEAVTALPAR